MLCLRRNTARVRRCREVASEVSKKWECSVAKFQQFKLRTDTDSVQGAEHRRAIPRSELTEAELQCHQRVLLTERHVRFPRIWSLWCSKEVKVTDTEEISLRLSRHSTLMENILISAMASLMEPTGEVVDEMILENPAGEHREGDTEFTEKVSADASHKEFSDRKLLESRAERTWRSSRNSVLSDMKTVRAVQKGVQTALGELAVASCNDEGSCSREGCFCEEPAGS